MDSLQRDSKLISRTLSRIGYNKDIRLLRQKTYDIMDASDSLQDVCSLCTSGSKAEGLSSISESDVDKMGIYFDVDCLEHPHEYNSMGHVFKLLKKKDNPGYAYLQLISINAILTSADLFVHCLVEPIPGQFYLSSDILKNLFKQAFTEFSNQTRNRDFIRTSLENHGPATVSTTLGGESNDKVLALKCVCPSYLNAWVKRARRYQWPSPRVINAISNTESDVVPVGCINSPLQFIEWRICFTKAEIYLVRSLNDCLIKALILMKGIAKVTLKPICKEMSTYIMKNIIVWIAEKNPADCFSENNLISVLQFAFSVLKSCLVSRNLPSYMIPERDFITDRVTIEQTSKLCTRIDCLLKEGSKMVMRIDKVRNALTMLYRSPEEFISYTDKRQEVEMIILKVSVCINETCDVSDLETFCRQTLCDDNFVRLVLYINRKFPELMEDSRSLKQLLS